jgi:hypothetical protein
MKVLAFALVTSYYIAAALAEEPPLRYCPIDCTSEETEIGRWMCLGRHLFAPLDKSKGSLERTEDDFDSINMNELNDEQSKSVNDARGSVKEAYSALESAGKVKGKNYKTKYGSLQMTYVIPQYYSF